MFIFIQSIGVTTLKEVGKLFSHSFDLFKMLNKRKNIENQKKETKCYHLMRNIFRLQRSYK